MSRKSILGLLFCICCTCASSAAPAGDRPYYVTDLGALGGGESRGYAVSSSGEAVGRSRTGHLVWHGFLYRDGAMEDLGTLSGEAGDESEAWGINDACQVAGWAVNADGKAHAFVYSAGAMSDLGTLGGWSSTATAINAAGQAAGHASVGGLFQPEHAFIVAPLDSDGDGTPDTWYRDDDDDGINDLMSDLGTLGGAQSWAHGLNGAGHAVGSALTVSQSAHAFLHAGGGMVDLGTLGGLASSAYAVNDADQVVGYAEDGDGNPRAFLFHDADGDGQRDANEMADLGTLGGPQSRARGVNAHGQVVGLAETAEGATHAFLHSGAAMSDLNDLIPDGSGWVLTEAWDICSDGRIVGLGENPSSMTHAFLLTPAVPGDADLDGNVDVHDYQALADYFGKTAAALWREGDFDLDGDVDWRDYVILKSHFGQTVQPAGQAVPEPATLSLLALAGLALVGRRRT